MAAKNKTTVSFEPTITRSLDMHFNKLSHATLINFIQKFALFK